MIYLDYSANTPVDDKVLTRFNDAVRTFYGNANSSHKFGNEAKQGIDNCINKIKELLHTNGSVIFTSGSSESNNLVIKGVSENYKSGKIIISALEHSSIFAPTSYLVEKGYEVAIIPVLENGIIDLDLLKKELTDDTIIVSITSVDSELGTIQPINEIGKLVHENSKALFHTDATQAIGKINIDFSNVDFISFTPHKFFGLPGIGVLINNNDYKLVPQIHGGNSTTKYRSGTPSTPDILALDEAITIAYNNLDERLLYIKDLSNYLESELINLGINLNKTNPKIPHVINFSVENGEELYNYLNDHDIYVSTKSACSLKESPSKSVLAITNDINKAKNSIRVSISHLTTKEEIDEFINVLKKYFNK